MTIDHNSPGSKCLEAPDWGLWRDTITRHLGIDRAVKAVPTTFNAKLQSKQKRSRILLLLCNVFLTR